MTGHITSVHEKEKAFECLVCCLTFADKWRLKRHITAVHEGEKPFQCVKCMASFTQNGSLKRHENTVHQSSVYSENGLKFLTPPQVYEKKVPYRSIMPLLCPICNTSFTRRGSLKRHIDTVHEKSTAFTQIERHS